VDPFLLLPLPEGVIGGLGTWQFGRSVGQEVEEHPPSLHRPQDCKRTPQTARKIISPEFPSPRQATGLFEADVKSVLEHCVADVENFYEIQQLIGKLLHTALPLPKRNDLVQFLHHRISGGEGRWEKEDPQLSPQLAGLFCHRMGRLRCKD